MSDMVETVSRAIFADLAPTFTEVKDWERLYQKQAEAYRSAARAAIAAVDRDEIEITPAMIEAGAAELGMYEPGECATAAFACFKAMAHESRKCAAEDSQ